MARSYYDREHSPPVPGGPGGGPAQAAGSHGWSRGHRAPATKERDADAQDPRHPGGRGAAGRGGRRAGDRDHQRELDGNDHPFVGWSSSGRRRRVHRGAARGTLLSPTVLLTAGHCTDGMPARPRRDLVFSRRRLIAESRAIPVSGLPGTLRCGTLGTLCATSDELYDYGFDNFAGFSTSATSAIVVLDQPIAMAEYGALAAVGDQLDALKTQRGLKDMTFTAVGYGVSSFAASPTPPPGRSNVIGPVVAHPKLSRSTSPGYTGELLATPVQQCRDTGGTCFGDSGGPNFLGTSNMIVGGHLVRHERQLRWAAAFSYRSTARSPRLDQLRSPTDPTLLRRDRGPGSGRGLVRVRRTAPARPARG